MTEPRFLVDLRTVVLAEGEALARIPLAKVGTWFKGKQKFSITRADMASIVATFRARKNGEAPLDYDHSMVYAAGAGEPVPAAGWLKEIEDEPDGDGILWGRAELTEKARGMVAAREYKYISPVIKWGLADRDTGKPLGAQITSVALTNAPVLDEMPAIALSEAGWVAGATESEEKTMAVKQVVLADRAAGKVRVILEDNTESLLSVEGLEAPPKVLALSDVQRGSDGRFDFSKLPQGGLIAGEVLCAMQAQGELDAAVKAGKILPAQRAAFEKMALGDLPGFRTLVASMKPQLDLGERGIAGGEVESGDLKKVDARLDQLTGEKMAADQKLSYGTAYRLVLSENPGLKARRLELMRAE